MAKCEVCNKGTMFGRKIAVTRSQVSGRSLFARKPNIRKVKVMDGATPKTMKVCANCLRAGKVVRA